MKGTPAIYLGRIVEKKHFRTFVFSPLGEKKLVESWDEFEACMQSGIWFATVQNAELSKALVDESKVKPKPRAKPKPKPKPEIVEEVDESDDVLPDDGSVFEVTDDFLPKENE